MLQELFVQKIDRFYHYEKDAAYCFSGHRHNTSEINVLMRGALEVTYNHLVVPLKAGDFFLIRPYAFHRNRVISADGVEFLVVQFTATGLPPQPDPVLHSCNANEQALCAMLLEELTAGEAQATDLSVAMRLLEALLCRMLRSPDGVPEAATADAAIYFRAVRYMQQHLTDRLQAPDIASACLVCPTILKRVFAEYAGQGAARYYLGLKMNYAQKALLHGKPSCEISEELGFSSPSYFSQCFQRFCGCTPSDYRQKYTERAQTPESE